MTYQSIRKHWLLSLFVVATAAGATALVACGVSKARHTLTLIQTQNDLKWIGLALHQYHDKHGHFPPAVVYDENAEAMHSWRSLIQPNLAATAETGDDYSAYDLRQRWNSLANTNATSRHRFGNHPYQFLAVVGPHTAWGSNGARKIADFSDGTSNTILVIAIRGSDIGWNEPRDAIFNGSTLVLGTNQMQLSHDAFVLTADGAVRYCAAGIPRDILVPMITADVGDIVPEW